MRPRLDLAHRPTPLWRHAALDALVGTTVWVKRDDATSGAAAGNKIRKLEYLVADALEKRSTVLVTCGGLQSNHARATALTAAEMGLGCSLLLRAVDPDAPLPLAGNVLLDRLAGATVRLITPEQYRGRAELMARVAEDLRSRGETPYVIPEGGSNALGALGYVDAMEEVRQQLDLGLAGGRPFDAIVHACGSGGTAAGVALGASRHGVAPLTIAMAVCDDRRYFDGVIGSIVGRAAELGLTEPAPVRVIDAYKGPAYGVADRDQIAFIVEVARLTGLIVDPVYTGKALFGLARLPEKPKRVLFIHTGGLPGLLAQGEAFASAVDG
jgi:D-cysteine desulfhydrase